MSAVALVGVTASGKSALALDLAVRRGDCEIVSVDSMCVYRGMDIGTSKPDAEARRAVPHHLLDLVDPHEEFTLTQFQRAAQAALVDIERRGRHALLVGGTGLYLRAVVDELEIPGRYPEVAAALEEELDAGGAEPADLHARLAGLDPVGAARMEPTNRRRVVRALEVTLGCGPAVLRVRPGPRGLSRLRRPAGRTRRGRRGDRPAYRRAVLGMVEAGLVEEVRGLAARSQGISRTVRQALGYREVLADVEHGVPLADCLDEAVRRTRQFARRQASWFRRDPRIAWSADPAEASERLERALCVHG